MKMPTVFYIVNTGRDGRCSWDNGLWSIGLEVYWFRTFTDE